MAGDPKPLRFSLFSGILFLIFFVLSLTTHAQVEQSNIPETTVHFVPAPPTNVVAVDHVYDRGDAIDISWQLSADDTGNGRFTEYQIFRMANGEADFIKLGIALPGDNSYTDKDVISGTGYRYKVAAIYNSEMTASEPSEIAIPDTELINWNLLNLFVIAFLIAGSVIYFIAHAKRGKKLFIRKIAGLEAVDEAIGRATEMGRPILFIPGINDMDDVQTIAGITILGRVAKMVADYDIKINMPV